APVLSSQQRLAAAAFPPASVGRHRRGAQARAGRQRGWRSAQAFAGAEARRGRTACGEMRQDLRIVHEEDPFRILDRIHNESELEEPLGAQQSVLLVALHRSVPSLAAAATVHVPPDGPAHPSVFSRERRIKTVYAGLTIRHVAWLHRRWLAGASARPPLAKERALSRRRSIGGSQRQGADGVAPEFCNLLSQRSSAGELRWCCDPSETLEQGGSQASSISRRVPELELWTRS